MISMITKIGIGIGAAAAIAAAGGILVLGIPEGKAEASDSTKFSAAFDSHSNDNSEPVRLAQQEGQSPQLPAQGFVRAGSLPGGASSLKETYQDWQVNCAQQQGAAGSNGTSPGLIKRCVMNQQQTNRESQQRVLAIEFTPAGDKLDGALVLPFGLALDQGATLQLDDGQVSEPLHYRTCLPAGCVVPLSFDARFVAALQKGALLKVKVTTDSGGDIPLSISLKGFAGAYSRLTALSH